MKACSAPVISADGSCSAAISVVFVSQPDLDDLGARVVRAARAVSERTAYIEGRRA
jgi:DNA-binding IclR family transcriptional regulator